MLHISFPLGGRIYLKAFKQTSIHTTESFVYYHHITNLFLLSGSWEHDVHVHCWWEAEGDLLSLSWRWELVTRQRSDDVALGGSSASFHSHTSSLTCYSLPLLEMCQFPATILLRLLLPVTCPWQTNICWPVEIKYMCCSTIIPIVDTHTLAERKPLSDLV